MVALTLGTSAVSVSTEAQAADLGDRLAAGETLSTLDQLTSSGGQFRFVVQGDGNAVVYSQSSAEWATSTFVTGDRFVLQADGNAVVYSPQNQPLWSSGTAGRSVDYMIMQGDGNLVIYGTDGRPTWSSRTSVITPPRLDTLLADAQLDVGDVLLAGGGYRAVMQSDGNFVVYGSGQARWSSDTRGTGNFLRMQSDGNAVVYSAAGQPLWHSRTNGNPGSRLLLQADGNLVTYKSDNSPSWSWQTGKIWQYSLDDPNSIWVVVNKLRPVQPIDYRAPDLIVTPVARVQSPEMRREAAGALAAMFSAGTNEGAGGFQIQNAYRSYATQKSIHDGLVARLGRAAAEAQSARPGHSEHQLGLAVDIVGSSGACSIQQCFESTSQGRWLAQNAWRFGFVMRYPQGKTAVTGYVYEPWHFRYVGTTLTAQMRASGITTLEEFFGLPAAPTYAG